MKTLDEVIKGFECCENIDCGNCPYKILINDDIHVPCDQFSKDEDALHYLKEYRDRKETLKNWTEKAISEQQNIADAYMLYKAALEKEKDNLPLTWDELREMEGKPVWVEQCNGDTKGWLLILRTNYGVITCTTKHGNSFYLYKSSYGEKWQAYRKEKNENAG